MWLARGRVGARSVDEPLLVRLLRKQGQVMRAQREAREPWGWHYPSKFPLTGPSGVFVGGDPAGGAGNDFDGEATYHLGSPYGSGALDAVQMKITVHTPGSQGADTKHAVVWVQPCEDETPPPPLNL